MLKSVVADFQDGYSETAAIYGLMTQSILKPPTSTPCSDHSKKKLIVHSYINNTGKIIAEAQITNGGPVILVQPENEYLNGFASGFSPNPYYVQDVEDEWRSTGIVMPFTV
jgi:hypothetical protein